MSVLQTISLYSMAFLYLFAGVCHFIKPKVFLYITPKWVPKPKVVNIIVGFAEMVLGILLLIPLTRSYAAIGVLILLVAVFPANVNHYLQEKRKSRYVLATLIRLPMQLLLLYWAYTFV